MIYTPRTQHFKIFKKQANFLKAFQFLPFTSKTIGDKHIECFFITLGIETKRSECNCGTVNVYFVDVDEHNSLLLHSHFQPV